MTKLKYLLLPLVLLASYAQAAITYIGGAQDSDGANTNTLTPTFEFSHQADDFCVVHAMSHDTGTDPVLALTVATGWSAITGSPFNHVSGTDRQNYIWYKKLTSSSETSPVITTDTSLAHSVTLNCFRGVDTTTALDAAALITAEDDNNLSLPDNPAIATQTNNAAILILQAIADGNGTAMVAGAPTNYTLGAHVDNDSTPQVNTQNAYAISAYDLDVGAIAGEDPGAWTHTSTTGTDAEDNSMFTIALRPSAAAAVTFSVSPTVQSTTATTYVMTYTVTGATTVYFVACNPGESVPNATQVEAGDCGSGADAEAAANEAVSGADTTTITGIAFPRHDIYAIPASGGTVVTLTDEDRTADAGQEFVELASVSGTSFLSLSTDSTGDTTDTEYCITGMTDTSDFAEGMLVDFSAGFADLTDILITQEPTADGLCFEIAANATTANITVTSNVYFNPTVAAGDIIEANSFAVPLISDGTHTGAGNAATLTDSAATFTVDALIDSRVSNDTDGSSCVITDNTATTVTCTLAGGTQNDWDAADVYTIHPVITWQTDGDFSFTAFSGNVLTSLSYCIQDDSDATGEFTVPACWATDDILYLFNSPPEWDVGTSDDILVWTIDEALSGVSMANLCTDVDGQTMTFVETGLAVTGVSMDSAGDITGTPTVEDEDGDTFSVLCGDPGQLYARQDFIAYPIETIALGDYTDDDQDAAIAEHEADFPWQVEELSLTATFECSDIEAANEVLSQDPVATTEVTAYEEVTIAVSTGPCFDLTGIPSGWYSIANALKDKEFIAIMRQEANDAGTWAYWLPGAPHGTANLRLDLANIRDEANGSAVWARWTPGVNIKNSGNLQINMIEAITADFIVSP